MEKDEVGRQKLEVETKKSGRGHDCRRPREWRVRADVTQTAAMLGSSGGWIRTSDLEVMSLTSFQAAPPRNQHTY